MFYNPKKWLKEAYIRFSPMSLPALKARLDAVKHDVDVFDMIPQEWLNEEIRLAAAVQDGWKLIHMSEEHRTPEICLAAVQVDARTLCLVPPDLRTLELCLIAVCLDGHALFHVPDKHLTPEICWAAIKQNIRALDYSPWSILELMAL